MERRVYVCRWERRDDEFEAWVKRPPTLRAMAANFAASGKMLFGGHRSVSVALLLTATVLAGCRRAPDTPPSTDTSKPPANSGSVETASIGNTTVKPGEDSALTQRASAIVKAIKARDGGQLASYVHPVKGVRFSPYAYVRADSDVVLSRAEVVGLFRDTTARLWGHQDGSGAPIRWPFERYYRTYVYDVDFAAAPTVKLDQPPARSGNTPSNLRDVYPAARWIEYHFPSLDPKFDGMDWRSLWVVLESYEGEWVLVGLVHGSWTI